MGDHPIAWILLRRARALFLFRDRSSARKLSRSQQCAAYRTGHCLVDGSFLSGCRRDGSMSASLPGTKASDLLHRFPGGRSRSRVFLRSASAIFPNRSARGASGVRRRADGRSGDRDGPHGRIRLERPSNRKKARYDFSLFDEAICGTGRAGDDTIFCTPTATPAALADPSPSRHAARRPEWCRAAPWTSASMSTSRIRCFASIAGGSPVRLPITIAAIRARHRLADGQ